MVAFLIVVTVVAFFFVLGSATPVFRAAYLLLPGMNVFRFPTRFLIVVELGLALLGAIGLTRLGADLNRRWHDSPRVPQLIVIAVCAGTVLDLFIHQPRQNPMVPARDWLTAPPTVGVVRADTGEARTFTPHHRDLHRRTFVAARGWLDVDPYFKLRGVLQPNTGGGFWNMPSADCYAGISARWYVDVWGDHNREASLVSGLATLNFQTRSLRVEPLLPKVLSAYGVSHVLSPYPQLQPVLTLVSQAEHAYVYRVDGAARVRFVRAARLMKTDGDAAARLRDTGFNPDLEILLHDAPDSMHPSVESLGEAPAPTVASRMLVTHEDSRHLVIEAEAPDDGFLLVADTFYPGWTAHVDGQPTPIYRANISVRGIRLPKGRHEVRMTYDLPGFARGLRITLLSVSTLLVWLGVAAYWDRRTRRILSI